MTEENTIEYYEEAKKEREEAIKNCGVEGCFHCSEISGEINLCNKKIEQIKLTGEISKN